MPSKCLEGLVVAVSGNHGTFYKHGVIKGMVEANNGVFSDDAEGCTHLITTQNEITKQTAKVKRARENNGHLVNLDWLLHSINNSRKEDEANYGFNLPGSQTNKPNSNSGTRSSKRRAGPETNGNSAEEPPAKKQRESQTPSTSNNKPVNVPVDEHCPKGEFEVYIDPDGVIWDATLNQTSSQANSNKFYRIQLLKDQKKGTYRTWTRWGRVGEVGQSAMLGKGELDEAKRLFEKKFKDKSGLKWENRLNPPLRSRYAFIERSYEEAEEKPKQNGESETQDNKNGGIDDYEPPKSNLPQPVQDLINFIFNPSTFSRALSDMSYDANKLPLGNLSKRTLTTGFEILKELAELINDPSLATSKHKLSYRQPAGSLSDRYYTIIPHAFGRLRPPIIDSMDMIKREVKLLESLSDMEIAHEIIKESYMKDGESVVDKQYKGLGMKEMTPLSPDSTEFKELEAYLKGSQGHTHSVRYQVINIFRIERNGEEDRFSSKYGNLKESDRRLLWHGSRSTNYGGILSQGLRIAPPEAPVTGYMFDKGVYFADMSSKSANYCHSSISGNIGLLLLCEVELGKPMLEQVDANYNASQTAKEKGCLSTKGLGKTEPEAWKDAGVVHPSLKGVMMPDMADARKKENPDRYLQYNEYIVYDVAQIRQRYLLQVRMKY